MKTNTLFPGRTPFSFEVFPPKSTSPIDTIYRTLDGLKGLQPDFISVTYGTGGAVDGRSTVEIASAIKNSFHIESVAHLPSLYLGREDVLRLLHEFERNGIENILALQGNRNPEIAPHGDFRHASDLVEWIREHGDFNIIGACYPEGHNDSASIIEDIRHLKVKVDAGVTQLISQLFFDNEYFYSFLERTSLAGIDVPIQAGIMPVVNRKQIERMVTLCGVQLPRKFVRMMERYGHNPEAMHDAGIAYAVDQIVDLAAQGVAGIHLYTMNNAEIARKISRAVANLLV